MNRLKNDARFIAIIILAVLATIVNSTLYLVSFMEDGFFMFAIIWLAWGFLKNDKP